VRALADRALGQVALARGEPAAGMLQAAFDAQLELGMPYEAARTRLVLARSLGANSEAAIAEARGALAAFEQLGAARDADEAAELLRKLGAPGRKTGPRKQAALSKREDEVLALLGEGLSNREIGARLFISAKTVEHHVGQILGKLDLKNRAAAAAYAVKQKSGGH
jgi:DNA-binding NarL/FixJ family response regulator